MNRILLKFINTWWQAPALGLLLYLLLIVSLILNLHPLPYVLFWLWVMAAMAQAFVAVLQFFRDEFMTGFISTALLIIPAGCFVLLTGL